MVNKKTHTSNYEQQQQQQQNQQQNQQKDNDLNVHRKEMLDSYISSKLNN